MSLENAHKLIRIYMGGLILGIDALYMLSCFLKQFALVGKALMVSQTSPGMQEAVVFFIIGQELSVNTMNYISTKVQYLQEHEYKT